MGVSDWDIIQGGDAAVYHERIEHSNVPAAYKLTHDVYARRLDVDAATGYGRQQFLYGTGAQSYANFDLTKDVSVRSAMCLGMRGADHVMTLGVRMSNTISTDTTNNKNISENGYHLRLSEDGANWLAALYRVDSGSAEQLSINVPLASGSIGDYKWFHLRLDFLLQSSGNAKLQVFTNDLVTNPINPSASPGWGASWEKIIEFNDSASNVPAYSRIGWGGQIDPGAAFVNEGYVDWTEFWHS